MKESIKNLFRTVNFILFLDGIYFLLFIITGIYPVLISCDSQTTKHALLLLHFVQTISIFGVKDDWVVELKTDRQILEKTPCFWIASSLITFAGDLFLLVSDSILLNKLNHLEELKPWDYCFLSSAPTIPVESGIDKTLTYSLLIIRVLLSCLACSSALYSIFGYIYYYYDHNAIQKRYKSLKKRNNQRV